MDSKKILSNENLKNGFSFNDTNNELSLKVNNAEKIISVDENGIKTDLSLTFDVDSGDLSIKGKNGTVIDTAELTNLHNYTGKDGIVVDNINNKIGVDDSVIVTHTDLTNTLSGLSLSETEFAGTKVLGKIKQENGKVTVSPRDLSKSDVGLGNVDNTSDADKPVSTAQAAAINAVNDKVTINTNAITKLNGNDSTEGSVAYAVKQLANGQVKTNKEAIAIINGDDETTGSIKESLKLAKSYTDSEIKKLDKDDAVVDHQFVSAVSETDGIISVSRKALAKEDIPTIDENQVSGLSTKLGTINTEIGKKVDKIDGKSLSTNDYTTEEKTKLSGIDEGANKYIHPTYTSQNSGLYKVTVDETGHVSGAVAVVKTDITALGIPGQDTTYSEATISSSGLMSATDKSKLDGIESGAKVNVIEGVQVNGADLSVTDKKVNVLVPTGALAKKDKISESDFDSALSTAFGQKEDKENLKALAYVDSLTADNIPSLDAAKIDSGTFNSARIPNLNIDKINNLQSTLNGKVDEFASSKRFDLTTDDGIITAIKSILMQMGVAESSITVP